MPGTDTILMEASDLDELMNGSGRALLLTRGGRWALLSHPAAQAPFDGESLRFVLTDVELEQLVAEQPVRIIAGRIRWSDLNAAVDIWVQPYNEIPGSMRAEIREVRATGRRPAWLLR